MATLALSDGDLVVRLSPLEKLGAFRFDEVRAPVSSISDARPVDDPWSELRGIRSPGTGLPGVIALGTRRGSFGKDFAAVYGKRPGVVIELDGADWGRIVLTTDDPAGTLRSIGR
jgi:hypothetical protein